VRAVEMTDHRHGDGEILPGLLAQLPEDERIAVISGDGAYDTGAVYEASAFRHAALLVPPRRNGKPCKTQTTGAEKRNETLCASGISGRASGSGRAAITDAASPRPPCHASSASTNASWPVTPTVRSLRCRSAALSSTPSTA
jgi:hypothetical protein